MESGHGIKWEDSSKGRVNMESSYRPCVNTLASSTALPAKEIAPTCGSILGASRLKMYSLQKTAPGEALTIFSWC